MSAAQIEELLKPLSEESSAPPTPNQVDKAPLSAVKEPTQPAEALAQDDPPKY